MKKLLVVLLIALLFTSCEKEELDVENVNEQSEELLEDLLKLNITIGDDTINNVSVNTIDYDEVVTADDYTLISINADYLQHTESFRLDIKLFGNVQGKTLDSGSSSHGRRKKDGVIDTSVTIEVLLVDYRGVDEDAMESGRALLSKDIEDESSNIDYSISSTFKNNGDLDFVTGYITFKGRNRIKDVDETQEITIEINHVFN